MILLPGWNSLFHSFSVARQDLGGPGTYPENTGHEGMRWAWYTLNGIITRYAHTTFPPRGNLEFPIHLAACLQDVWGNWRTWTKPIQTWGEHMKPCTGSNLSSWSNQNHKVCLNTKLMSNSSAYCSSQQSIIPIKFPSTSIIWLAIKSFGLWNILIRLAP